MEEAKYPEIIREIEEFLKKQRARPVGTNSETSFPPNDVTLGLPEVYDVVQEFLGGAEQMLMGIPNYVQAAARAHIHGENLAQFPKGEDQYAVICNLTEQTLRILRFQRSENSMKTLEYAELSGGRYEDNQWQEDPLFCYQSDDVYALRPHRPDEKYPVYNTVAAREGIRGFLQKLVT